MDKKTEKDAVELPELEKEIKNNVKIDKVIDIRDVERLVKKVLQKNIVLANLKEIKNFSDYQNVIKEFKRYSSLYKLNLLLIDDNYLLITSKDISIEKLNK